METPKFRNKDENEDKRDKNRWKVHQAGVKRTRTGCYKVKPERGSGAGS